MSPANAMANSGNQPAAPAGRAYCALPGRTALLARA
jgi:hypothetical protein